MFSFLRTIPFGRANLLVSRVMMFAIIGRKNVLFAGVHEKRLTGRFALPNINNLISPKQKQFGWFRVRTLNREGDPVWEGEPPGEPACFYL